MPDLSAEEHKALVRRFVEITNSGQHDLLDEIMAPNFVRHSQSTPAVKVTSLEEFKQFLRDDSATFPDAHITLKTLVAEGTKVAIFGEFAGTQTGPMGPFPATGKPVAVDMSGIFRIQGEKIAEMWVVWDNMMVLAQLGHFSPPPAAQME